MPSGPGFCKSIYEMSQRWDTGSLPRMFLGLTRRLRAHLRDVGKPKRSPKWPEVQRAFLVKHVSCEACNSTTRLQVHHKLPFHLRPELELDEGNLVVLCMGRNACHLLLGHGDDFRAYNPAIKLTLAGLRTKLLDLPGARIASLKARVYS